jgi:hypothetical protein
MTQTFQTFNPATGEVLATLPIAGQAEVDAAVARAAIAQKEWAKRTGTERGRILRRAAEILRERAPAVLAWTARLWNAHPGRIEAAPLPATAPRDLDSLLQLAARDHLAELDANALAAAGGLKVARFRRGGVDWRLPVSPYRVQCLADLQVAFAALGPAERAEVQARLGTEAGILARPVQPTPLPARRIRNRLWT